MSYKSLSYFENIWGIKSRRIRVLCQEGRVEGAKKFGRNWFIPEGAAKPLDKRFKATCDLSYEPIDFSEIYWKKEIIDRFRPFKESISKQLKDKLIVEWTYNSNAIEGNTLTLSETKVVLENGITIKGKSLKDHLETVNHKEAILFLEELISESSKLTEYNIKSLHHLILKEINSNNAGIYRKENVLISGASHIPPSYIEVPLEMQKLIEQYNTTWQEYSPIVRACFLHGEFVKIHPFIDGNGRTARILLNFELMKNGFPPIVIKNDNRVEYYDSLDKANTTNDYTDFIKYVTNLVNETEDMYLFILDK